VILYLDASAVVKRYVSEPGSTEVRQAIATATAVGMVVIGRRVVLKGDH
jgi:predicted nucleic acid-binding protein